jgi:hypothetical protein
MIQQADGYDWGSFTQSIRSLKNGVDMKTSDFNTDTLKDAIFSLHMTAECLDNVANDSHYWKWVIIALHNSLQGFMVNALCFGNDLPVLDKRSLREWMDWRRDPDSNPPPGRRWLVKFPQLYKRIKKPKYMGVWGGKAFEPKGTQDASVKTLINDMRNYFIHFKPAFMTSSGWQYLPVVKDVTEVISFLALESDTISWFGGDDPRERTNRLIEQIMARLNELEQTYADEIKNPPPPDPGVEQWWAGLKGSAESSEKE